MSTGFVQRWKGKVNAAALFLKGIQLPPYQAGQHTVTSGEATAQTLDIATGLPSISAYTVQVVRSGKLVASDVATSTSSGTLTVANGTTFTLTAADVINWVAVGAA